MPTVFALLASCYPSGYQLGSIYSFGQAAANSKQLRNIGKSRLGVVFQEVVHLV